MALNVGQYLAPLNSQQVLSGYAQGVIEGPGIVIASDGTISLNPTSGPSLGFLTSSSTPAPVYNWSTAPATAGAFLVNDGSSNVSWSASYVPTLPANQPFPHTGAAVLPSGASSDRPTLTAGAFRYNTTTGTLEYSDGFSWIAVSDASSTVQSFFGTVTPTASNVGDLWFDSNTAQEKVWTGSLWIPTSPLATATVPGRVQIGTNIQVDLNGVISVPSAVGSSGGVSSIGLSTITDNTSSFATDSALSANQGRLLQLQIASLLVSSNLTLAGLISGTGTLTYVTTDGAAQGFVVGSPLPASSAGNNNYFVIVEAPGSFTPPGGSLTTVTQGDWFLSTGTGWQFLNVGYDSPAATTATPGIVQLSTNAQTQTGTDATLAVTPASLSSRTATETRTGLAEIATQAETNAGTDDTRFVTPLKLITYLTTAAPATTAANVSLSPAINGNVNAQTALQDAVYDITSTGNTVTITSAPTGLFNIEVAQATETLRGGAEVATQAEVNAGADDTRFVTPLKLATYISGGQIIATEIPLSPIINGNTTVQAALNDAIYNVASSGSSVTITETATGQINLAIAQATETQLGGGEIATQAETNTGTSDTVLVTPLKLRTAITGGAINSSNVQLSTAINGNTTVQSALADAVYDITSTGNTIVITSSPTGLFNVEVRQATETQLGGAEVATQAEVNAGTDDTRIVTPLKLAGRVASETLTGIAEIATQAEVNAGTDDARFVTPLKLATYISGGQINATEIPLSPAINGNTTVQSALNDALYNITSSNLTVSEAATGQVTITLPNTAVTAGAYTYGSFTVDAQGRLTAASSGTAPVTAVTGTAPIVSSGGLTPAISLADTAVVPGAYTYSSITVDAKGRLTAAASGTAPNTTVVAPITNTGTAVAPIIGITASSTTGAGAVQLNDTTSSTSTTLALTAAQGKNLQDQINVLTVATNLVLAGTFNATTGLMVTVTSDGTAAGFTVGSNLPAPAPALADFFVLVTTAGSYSPPGGGGPYTASQGDWFVCNGTTWDYLNVGFDAPSASTTAAGIVELATNAETQAGTDATRAVTPASLQSKLSDSIATTSSTTIASSTAVKTAYDLANAAIPKATLTAKGDIVVSTAASTPTALAVGTNGQVLSANSAATSGLCWITPCSGTLTSIATGTGLTGGPITTTGTISLANTAVTAGAYTNASITVDAQGRLTAASSGASPVLCSTVTAKGDLIAGTAAGTVAALPIGTNGQVLAADSACACGMKWQTITQCVGTVTNIATGTGLTGGPITTTGTIALANTAVSAGSYTAANITVDAQGRLTAASNGSVISPSILTTTGDMIYASAASTAARLGIGTSGQVLAVSAGGLPVWCSLAPGGVTNVTATAPLASSGGATPNLTISAATTAASGAVQLNDTVTSTSTALAATANSVKTAYDLANAAIPKACVTAKGALISGTAASTPTALTVGTDGQHLVADSTQATGLRWATITQCTGTVTSVATGTGLTGGPVTTTGTISLANTAVTAGSYTYASLTVDAQGRLTAASNGTAPVTTVTGTAPIVSSGGTTPAISLANTAVTAGAYTYASFTVDAQGRLTAASSGTTPNTTVVAPITNTGTAVAPVIGITASSTTGSGAVQLNDTTSSTATNLALTANQGKNLQDQINALTIATNLTFAGTFNASTSQMSSVSADGSAAGFVVGSNLPAPAAGNTDYFVIATTAGSYSPPGGGGPYSLSQGDWLLSNGTVWQYLNVGLDVAYASTTASGVVELATNAETQTGTDATLAVTAASLQSKLSDSIALTSSSTIASSTAVKTAYDLANAAIPKTCITGKGALVSGTAANTPTALPVGTNGQVLTADSTCTSGLKWATPATTAIRNIDDISGSFNGTTTAFPLAIGGVAYTPNPTTNIAVFLGGVAQTPGAGNAYTVAGSTITFTSAPPTNTTFYAFTVC